MDTSKQIVIIGANFAGLTTALRLSERHDVVIIDPSPRFEFLHNIHELISGVKSPD
ncbi:MAG: NAD(P)/FAD-dependent oxidoreductase, partial [Silicimonas sp.]|nr:NAD(P)/FAD-dependent oxidoreductase [Silicimonas sp.]